MRPSCGDSLFFQDGQAQLQKFFFPACVMAGPFVRGKQDGGRRLLSSQQRSHHHAASAAASSFVQQYVCVNSSLKGVRDEKELFSLSLLPLSVIFKRRF